MSGLCGRYICVDDVDNWPSGMTDEERLDVVLKVEALIDRVTRTRWTTETFDCRLNGNDRDRIFLPLDADVLAVTAVEVNGAALDAAWYAHDAVSVYRAVDVPGSGALFPRGYNNIRVVGLYGVAAVPAWVRQVAVVLVRAHNEPSLYPTAYFDSESIGDYSYRRGDEEHPTGIVEADKWLRLHQRRRTRLAAP